MKGGHGMKRLIAIICGVLAFSLAFGFLCVGYAYVTRDIKIEGLAEYTPPEAVFIIDAEPKGSGGTVNGYATHTIDQDGKYKDTKTFGDTTETYNKSNSTPDTTNRNGSESSTDNRTIGVTQNENEGAVQSGKQVDDATTHDAGSKVDEGQRVDDALTVDDNLKKDNGSDAHTNREYGKIGVMTYQEMVLKYRETFLNIDMMIIDELKDLFMKVW